MVDVKIESASWLFSWVILFDMSIETCLCDANDYNKTLKTIVEELGAEVQYVGGRLSTNYIINIYYLSALFANYFRSRSVILITFAVA